MENEVNNKVETDEEVLSSNVDVIKRNGKEVRFDQRKIQAAIRKANKDVDERYRISDIQIRTISYMIKLWVKELGHTPTVDEIQDKVVISLGHESPVLQHAYDIYRYDRDLERNGNSTDREILSLVDRQNEIAMQENSNKNPIVESTQRDYIAGLVSRDISERILFDKDLVEAHREGKIHIHDTDYFLQTIHNCDLVNLEDMLQNGTVISGTLIRKPHSFRTACNIATQVIAQVASAQYGGQTITLSHLAPFVDVSRQAIRKAVIEEGKISGVDYTDEIIDKITHSRLKKEITDGIQTLNYQLVTLLTTNGQTPFVTIFMYIDEVPEGQTREDLVLIIEEVLRQRMDGTENEDGVKTTPAFPKLIYCLDEDNVKEGTKYWDTTVLAAQCTAKRMNPDYISAKIMREQKGDVYPCMGCRSFLTPDRTQKEFEVVKEDGTTEIVKPLGNIANAKNYDEANHKYYGRFNQGVCTISLPDVALSSGGDKEKFWKIFDERLEMCHRVLQTRHNRLMGTPSDVAPILWQYGALARLEKHETIDKLLFHGYSTISLGYAGLYECTKYMTGESHTDEKAGKPFALEVMKHMNDAYAKWKKAEDIDYSLYGTPIESTTYKFAKALQTRFGIIEGITDHGYITNSYHVNVREKIDAFKKLEFEAEFQNLSPGGAVSYVEVPDMQSNIPAVLSIMQYIYEHIMYAELNTKSDYCMNCGYDGEIQIVKNENGKLIWKCPKCGNTDQSKMSVARRTCGYIGTQYWNQGRTEEIQDRVMHVSLENFKPCSCGCDS